MILVLIHRSDQSKVRMGSDPPLFYRLGEFGTSLVLRGRDVELLAAATQEVVALVRGLGGDPREE